MHSRRWHLDSVYDVEALCDSAEESLGHLSFGSMDQTLM